VEDPRVTALDSAPGALAFRSISKRFGRVVAVDDVTLDLPAGSFFSLLGPSGCGKTSLLRVVAGLETADSGQVLVDGQDITGQPPERRPFNMVFQRYALFPHLTIYDNIAFGLTTRHSDRLSKDEVRTRVGEILEMVGLRGYERRWPSQLSGGQAQRVALARALVRRPTVLLLDEPLAALDRNVRHQVREELLRIHSELGTTFLFVTHDQDEALSISGVVGLMNAGRLEQVADPQTLYSRPATLFAARFIGAGSFLDARVLYCSGSEARVAVSEVEFSAADAGVEPGKPCQVLLRPEDLSLVAEGSGRVGGVVETCSFFGSFFELTVRTALGVVRLRDKHQADPGSRVRIGWPDVAGIAYPGSAGSLAIGTEDAGTQPPEDTSLARS
jgi:ABC-type Fe3+/spermidine/putrescine transport system ATPase subunit